MTAAAIAVTGVVYLTQQVDTIEAAGSLAARQCDTPTPIKVVVAPEVRDAVTSLIESDVPGGAPCHVLRVVDGDFRGVLGVMGTGSAGAPDVVIPDSSMWLTLTQAGGGTLRSAGSFAASPVVLATTAAVADAAGWASVPPSWPEALASDRRLAVPDPRWHAPSLLALAAARRDVQSDPATVQRITAATALNQQRGNVIAPFQGMATLAPADASAPLVIGGAAYIQPRLGEAGDGLVAITPTGGVPSLDYPVVVRADDGHTAVQRGIDRLVELLLSPQGEAAAAANGLGLPMVGIDAAPTSPEELTAIITELTIVSRPSQVLVVVDISTSMLAEAAPGASRADVAGQALAGALPLLPDASRVGLWVFASALDGDLDYRVVAPTEQLDTTMIGSLTQRDLLSGAVAALPGSLQPGGTSLYDVTLAAMLSAQENWDPEVVSTIVIITDGKNEDSTGYTLEQLNAEIRARADPRRPVALIAVAFGEDADLDSMRSFTAAAAAGWGPAQAVDARDPGALASLMVESLSARIAAAGAGAG